MLRYVLLTNRHELDLRSVGQYFDKKCFTFLLLTLVSMRYAVQVGIARRLHIWFCYCLVFNASIK